MKQKTHIVQDVIEKDIPITFLISQNILDTEIVDNGMTADEHDTFDNGSGDSDTI